ncbi:hypothetical protein C9374_007818 [Naegleria lovaniensis]|uniref:Transmembrane protein n=1 Tax=Naegleria lovaniensis TaxID=51637 RepID=A0AA88KGJ2_NAELO|nr:uncharacterized protein C9374_007818 [Naegleria lovaniensis]KAG2378670.1 hypothetical protein C9374_007818 [Naegleria lovaniensis]
MILVLRQRKIPIKKNPKILFTIVVIFVAIQCFNLIIRAMYDIWNINAHYRFDGGQQVFKASYFLGMNVMGALSTWTFFWNYVFVFVILFFVQLMFWKTAWSLRAISKRFYHFFRILNIVIFSIFISIEILVVALIPFIEYASETGLIETNTRTNLTIGLFSALIWMFLFDTFTAVLSGICIVKGIRQNQSKFATKGQNSLLSLNKNNPFVVTLGLTIGLILCILCQLLAAGIATSTLSLDRTGLKVIWHGLSS